MPGLPRGDQKRSGAYFNDARKVSVRQPKRAYEQRRRTRKGSRRKYHGRCQDEVDKLGIAEYILKREDAFVIRLQAGAASMNSAVLGNVAPNLVKKMIQK